MEVAASQGADSALPRPLRLLQEVSPTPPWPLLSWAPQCWAGLDWGGSDSQWWRKSRDCGGHIDVLRAQVGTGPVQAQGEVPGAWGMAESLWPAAHPESSLFHRNLHGRI